MRWWEELRICVNCNAEFIIKRRYKVIKKCVNCRSNHDKRVSNIVGSGVNRHYAGKNVRDYWSAEA